MELIEFSNYLSHDIENAVNTQTFTEYLPFLGMFSLQFLFSTEDITRNRENIYQELLNSQKIRLLPTPDNLTDDKCPICLENYKGQLIQTLCNHVYHETCC